MKPESHDLDKLKQEEKEAEKIRTMDECVAHIDGAYGDVINEIMSEITSCAMTYDLEYDELVKRIFDE